jgi:hypothetical protein
VNIEFLGDLLDRFDVFERFNHRVGLEFWVVSLRLPFIWWVSVGLMPSLAHRNHRLTNGPILWDRLTGS